MRVDAVDTTGAGDGFIGSFLFKLMKDGITVETLETLTEEALTNYLNFSTLFCRHSVLGEGAIDSYPNMNEMRAYIEEMKSK